MIVKRPIALGCVDEREASSLSEPVYCVPFRKTLTNRLEQQYAEKKAELREPSHCQRHFDHSVLLCTVCFNSWGGDGWGKNHVESLWLWSIFKGLFSSGSYVWGLVFPFTGKVVDCFHERSIFFSDQATLVCFTSVTCKAMIRSRSWVSLLYLFFKSISHSQHGQSKKTDWFHLGGFGGEGFHYEPMWPPVWSGGVLFCLNHTVIL